MNQFSYPEDGDSKFLRNIRTLNNTSYKNPKEDHHLIDSHHGNLKT
jgi:hypothetical protein